MIDITIDDTLILPRGLGLAPQDDDKIVAQITLASSGINGKNIRHVRTRRKADPYM